MYKEHMPVIRDAMRADVKVFRRGVMFAVCSIRQPTINVPDQLGILFDGEQGENPLFGHKFNAWAYINDEEKCAALWRTLRGDYVHTRASCEEAILALLCVPGLGIVKAAFICQLMGFDVACLDARNVTREGRNPRAFRTDGKKPEQLVTPVKSYVSETYGKAEYYWDAWCHDVANAYHRSAEEISALHLSIIPNDYIPF